MNFRITKTPARSEQYQGEWYVVRVWEDGKAIRESGLVNKPEADRLEAEWKERYDVKGSTTV